jgi:hypothetical protein
LATLPVNTCPTNIMPKKQKNKLKQSDHDIPHYDAFIPPAWPPRTPAFGDIPEPVRLLRVAFLAQQTVAKKRTN